MKRFLLILTALVLAFSAASSAQGRFGVSGGMTFSEGNTLGHIGVTWQQKVAMGFSFQPSVLFNMKGMEGSQIGSVEVPVAVQWGPDLLLFRPYVEFVPFVGVNIFGNGVQPTKMECGFGLGGGLEIWKIQVDARYNWNVNPYSRPVEYFPEGPGIGVTTLTFSILF